MIKNGVFVLRKRRAAKVDVKRSTDEKRIDEEKEQITLIQGQVPGSIEEWRFAQALDFLKVKYYYQYSVMGGAQGLRGGQIIDFLVKTAPLPTPVYIQGEYWHYSGTKRQESAYKIAALMAEYRGTFAEPIEIPASLLTSIDDAVEIAREYNLA